MEVALQHGHQVMRDGRLRTVLLVLGDRFRAQAAVLVLVSAEVLVQQSAAAVLALQLV
tara:strand:+ start:1382 stop:1555 length:174 start_codon:yes stop_codon:yes gene_type:complete